MTSPCPVVRTLTAAIDCAKQTHNVTGVTSQLRPSPGLRLVATVTNVPGLISGRLHLLLQNFSRPLHSTFCYYCCAPPLWLSSSSAQTFLVPEDEETWHVWCFTLASASLQLPFPSLFCATLYSPLITARETWRGRASRPGHLTIQVLNRTKAPTKASPGWKRLLLLSHLRIY